MKWPIVSLNRVAAFINGDRGKNYPSKGDFIENGIPFINAGNIASDHSVDIGGLSYISEDHFHTLNGGKIEKGDIIFCLRGSLGKFAIIHNNMNGAIASSLVIIRPNKLVDLNYLKHYLSSFLCQREIKAYENGAAQPNLSAKDLKSFKIPLPPFEEQKRIATILDKADVIRQKRQQAIALSDDFLRSVFLDMFGDPVTNPNRWPIKKLGKIVDCINGDRSINYPSGNDIVDSGVLFLSTKNIKNGHLDLSTTQYITMEKFKSLSRGKLQRNDLVITLRGTLAQSAIFDTELDTGFINAQLMILRCSNDIHPIFLHALLMSNSFNSYLKSIGNGAAVPQLTAAQIKDLDIYIPQKAEQEKYIKISSTVSVVEKKQNQHLSSHIFNALSKKAFLGQL